MKYREAELLNKEHERMRRLEEQKAAEAEKEEILEAIRQKVKFKGMFENSILNNLSVECWRYYNYTATSL